MNETLAPRRRWRDSAAVPVLAVAVAVAAFVTWRLERRGWDPSVFVVAGEMFVDPAIQTGLRIRRGQTGYDGQFCYRLALDPFTRLQSDFGIEIDAPRRRQQRILYPLLAWAAALGGRPALVPWSLLLVNAAALCVMAGLGGRLAVHFGRAAAWGVAFPVAATYVLTLTRDLNEIVAGTMLLGAVLALVRRRHAAAAVTLSLAVLGRETSLLLAAGIAIDWLWSRVRREAPATPLAVALVPVLIWLGWYAWLRQVWVGFPSAMAADIGLLPLHALFGFMRDSAAFHSRRQLIHFLETCALLAWAAVLVARLRHSSVNRAVAIASSLSLALLAMLNRRIWIEDWSFLRVFTEAHLTGTAVLLSSPGRLSTATLAASVAAGVWMGFEVLVHR